MDEARFTPETQALQRELIAGGYLEPYREDGRPSDDGWFGPKTREAQARRDSDLALMPLPAVPWWRTRRMKGLLLAVAGLAGFFVPALKEVDTSALVNLVWDNLDHVEQIITSVSALIALVGALWSQLGAAKATAPVDATLVAKVGTRELRLPGAGAGRVWSPAAGNVQAHRQAPRRAPDQPKSRDRGPFFYDS